MSYSFSDKSIEKLYTCHEDLQLIFQEAIKRSKIDFGISEGHRTTEKQIKLYSQGRTEPGEIVTHIDGVTKKGKHNHRPSLAVDIFPYVKGKVTYKRKYLRYIAGVILDVSREFKARGIIKGNLYWGGFWLSFEDLPHFELDHGH